MEYTTLKSFEMILTRKINATISLNHLLNEIDYCKALTIGFGLGRNLSDKNEKRLNTTIYNEAYKVCVGRNYLLNSLSKKKADLEWTL